ncbi:MAG: hydroxyacid dehydrogenase [Armatimonadetes bacterium]|nr:hydroxyacid dehydrogenase [Armatimonadota bacterium]
MATILCAMPEHTYRRMMTTEREAELRALGDVTLCLDAHALTEEGYGALWERADAAVTGWGTRAPTPAMLDRARRLRIISHTAGSVRWLPRYALEKRVVVTSAQAAIARTVAEFCLLNALTLLRRRSETLYGKTAGLVGFGHVGRLFRQHLAAFGCHVLVSEPALSEEEAARSGVECVALPALLQGSKVISLHAPDIPATRGMIGAPELALIPDGAVFLNSARGRLVDTGALTEALAAGRFSAALDVTEPEPLPPDHPLRSLPNVLLTPHVAGPTDDELPELTRMALTDLARFLRGEPPLHPISLEAYDVMSF